MEHERPAFDQTTGGAARQVNPATIKDRVFVFVALALGYLFFELIFFEGFGIAVPIYMALFYTAIFWYLSGKPGGMHMRGLWLMVPVVSLSACFALYDNMALSLLNFLLMVVLVVLQLSTISGNRLYKTFSFGLVADLFHTGVAQPLVNIPAPFRALRSTQAGGTGRRSRVSLVFIGLAIALPLLAVVLSLLVSADLVFEKMFNGLFSFINEHIAEYVVKVILGFIAAVLLFGLLSALRYNRKIGAMKVKVSFDRLHAVDEAIVSTILIALNIVYILFIAVQFGYLLNAFASILPQDFTYAGYARRGFFELMGVSFINLCVLAASLLFSRRSGKGRAMLLKVMETALILLTFVLIASAMAKMVMYMDAYGLTLMRVYVTWFMILCTAFFAAMLVKLYVPRFPLVKVSSMAFVLLFLALNFAGVDRQVAAYNIDRYTSGKSATVDVEMFYDLSDSMIPEAARLLDDSNAALAAEARELLGVRADILTDSRWQVYSWARANARKVLTERGIEYKARESEYME